MLYCRYRNGRLEAELPSGEIISFEDMDEMREFIDQRRGVSGLVGKVEQINSEFEIRNSNENVEATGKVKAKKIRIHKGVYTVENGRLIKEKTA
jgi:hypothetical protein